MNQRNVVDKQEVLNERCECNGTYNYYIIAVRIRRKCIKTRVIQRMIDNALKMNASVVDSK